MCRQNRRYPSYKYVYSTDQYTRVSIRKRYSIPYTGLDRSLGFQEAEDPSVSRQQTYKGEKVTAVGTGRPYPRGNTPGAHFC